MSKHGPTYQELETRLAAAEPVVEALKHHQVDAVVGEEKITFLLLREVGEALRASDAGFRAMFELSGVGMFQAESPAFRLTSVNQKFCEIVGYSPEELRSQTCIGIIHPQHRRGAMNALAQVLRGKTDSWSREKRCIRKDGTVIWIAVNGAALRDESGSVVRIMAMVTDITARKQAEQALRERSRQLRKLAAALTLAEHRERRRIAQILHDHIAALLLGVKRRPAPRRPAEEKTVRQALQDVQNFIDQSIVPPPPHPGRAALKKRTANQSGLEKRRPNSPKESGGMKLSTQLPRRKAVSE